MHPYLSRNKKINFSGNVNFQIVDIYAKDEQDLYDEEKCEYMIHLFGITENSESVHLKVTGFRPYFFIKVPQNFSTYQANQLKNYINGNLSHFNKNSFKGCKLEKRMDYYGFNNFKKENFICLYFENRKCLYEVKKLLSSARHLGFIPKFYESKLEPFLRFLHIQEVQPAGWVTVAPEDYKPCTEANSQIDITTKWTKVHPYETKQIAPYLQASFDIECVAGDGIRFPEADQDDDCVIQIGTTVYKLGDDNINPLKHIVTLKSCDPIPGTIVESYETEEEMLMGWINFIQKLDPDIITGYNIYGFDFKYIHDRAKKLGILYQFEKLSRFRNYRSVLIEKKLSSAALGSNVMYYMDSPGRLLIDLYKVCQRDYNFESYKLDDVAGEFICGKIIKHKIGKKYTYLTVSSVADLEVGNFIGITVNKLTKFEHGKSIKFKVAKIQKDKLVIEGVLDLPKDKPLQWKLMKDDMKYTDLFKFQNKDSKHRSIIGKYCIQDNILCNKLMDKLKILVNNIGMANVCYVPMSYLFLRGQGIKAYSLVAKRCRIEGYLIPDKEYSVGDGDKFQGATVLNATAGGYFHPISCNDFASLYPSSIISHNLSPDTYIINPKFSKNVKHNKIVCNESTSYNFVKPEEGDVDNESLRKGRGIIPKVLIDLLASRKHVKGLMKHEKDPFQKSILDGLQLSYKLTCNSIYGQLGSSYSSIACKPAAEATTAVSRGLLQIAADETKKLYPDCEIIYGDSVTGDTPLLMRYPDGNMTLKTIETLSNEWKQYDEFKPFDTLSSNRRNKEQSITDMEVWTDNGWNPIKRVIRHKCNKKIYRVNTHYGVVDVTEDHSLLNENGEKLKSSDCIISQTKLLQSYPTFEGMPISLNEIINSLNNMDEKIISKKSFLYGFFYGDGSCDYYQCNSGAKYSWAINNNNYEILKTMQKWLTDVYSMDFKILDTMESSGVYKLVPVGDIKKMVIEFRSLFYDKERYKIIPDNILNGSYQERLDFFKGYYLADGAKCTNTNTKNIRMCNKGKIGSAQLYYLMKSLGYKTSIQIRSDKEHIYRLTSTSTTDKQRKIGNIVKKVVDLGYNDDYVYDLETVKGRFQAGIGEIIVSNTDSLFIKYIHVKDNPTPEEKQEALQKSIDCAMQVEKIVSSKLPWPHNLEYEKTYYPYILYSKKRYSGVMYEFDTKNYTKIDNKGIVLKRRDNAKIVKYIFGGALNIILFEQNIDKAFEFIKKTLEDLCEGKFSQDFLVISKTLRVTKTDPAHKILAQRMACRDPGNAPNLNDRIPYIYIELRKQEEKRILAEQGRKKLLQGDKIEHPDYVTEHNLKPDYHHYITNQIMKPLLQLLAIFEKDTESMKDKDADKVIKLKEQIVEKKLFHNIIRRQQARQNGMRPLDMFFKKVSKI